MRALEVPLVLAHQRAPVVQERLTGAALDRDGAVGLRPRILFAALPIPLDEWSLVLWVQLDSALEVEHRARITDQRARNASAGVGECLQARFGLRTSPGCQLALHWGLPYLSSAGRRCA